MTPRFGPSPRPGIRYGPRRGAYAVLVREGRVLVTHQTAPQPEYQLPGGGIDPGESPLRALAREVREETGWTIARPRRLGVFRRFAYMPEYRKWAEKICLIYLAWPVRAVSAPSEPGHSAHWLTAAEAAQRLGNPGDRWYVTRAFPGLARPGAYRSAGRDAPWPW
jgi:8-oxo-dGTP diphosphatase